MKKHRLESWLNNIYTTQEEEINCSECFDSVSRYVELELSGGDPAAVLPKVTQHLSQCRACREEYEILRDLRRLEDHDASPSVDDLRHSIR